MRKVSEKLLLYIGGLLILATGVNIAKTAQLGLSPVTAIPYAMELIWNINLGKATLFFYLILIALQIILLRRNYKPIQILQIVGTFFIWYFCYIYQQRLFIILASYAIFIYHKINILIY